jgi:hypothetical protein
LEFPKTGASEAVTEGKIQDKNTIYLNSAAKNATIWLSPEMVNFEELVKITGMERKPLQVTPTAKTLLEDVRTRGDRQHPFWAKVELK